MKNCYLAVGSLFPIGVRLVPRRRPRGSVHKVSFSAKPPLLSTYYLFVIWQLSASPKTQPVNYQAVLNYIALFFELGRFEVISADSLTRTFWQLTRGSGGGAPSGVRGRAPRSEICNFCLSCKRFLLSWRHTPSHSNMTQK